MGGRVFKNIETRRIGQEEISETMRSFMKAVNIPGFDFAYVRQSLVGSTGKTLDSGDMDIVLNTTKSNFCFGEKEDLPVFDPKDVLPIVKETLGEDKVVCTDPDEIHIAYPINGEFSCGFVQIDLIFGDWLWTKFMNTTSMYSDFKSLHRFHFMLAMVNTFPLQEIFFPSGKIKAVVRYHLTLNKGMTIVCKHRENENESLRVIPYDEFETKYSEAIHVPRNYLTTNPEDFIRMFLGLDYRYESFYNFETVVRRFSEFSPEKFELAKKFLSFTLSPLEYSETEKFFFRMDTY